MKKTESVVTMSCDQCGKQLANAVGSTFGGSPFYGWFHLKKTDGGTTIDAIRSKKSWDFCCMSCLSDFVDDFKVKVVSPTTSPKLAVALFEAHRDTCTDKLLTHVGLDGSTEVHCLNAGNTSTDLYPFCASKFCPHVYKKLGNRKGDK